MSRIGVAFHMGEAVLNHAMPGVAAVYDHHDYNGQKREALEKWAEHVLSQ